MFSPDQIPRKPFSTQFLELENITYIDDSHYCSGRAVSFSNSFSEITYDENIKLGTFFAINFKFELSNQTQYANTDQYILRLFDTQYPAIGVHLTNTSLHTEIILDQSTTVNLDVPSSLFSANGTYVYQLKRENENFTVSLGANTVSRTINQLKDTMFDSKSSMLSLLIGHDLTDRRSFKGRFGDFQIWNGCTPPVPNQCVTNCGNCSTQNGACINNYAQCLCNPNNGYSGPNCDICTNVNKQRLLISFNGDSRTVFRADTFSLEGFVRLSDPACFYPDRNLTYSWEQVQGEKIKAFANTSKIMSSSVLVNAFDIPYPSNFSSPFIFKFTVFANANSTLRSERLFPVFLRSSGVVAGIVGGTRRLHSISNILSLNSSSFDPDMQPNVVPTYEWACSKQGSANCSTVSNSLVSSSSISIPANTLESNSVYTFSLKYKVVSREASALVTVETVSTEVVSIKILALPAKVNPSDEVSVEAEWNTVSNTDFTWNVTEGGLDIVSPNNRLTSRITNIKTLKLKKDVLVPGRKYTFQVVATNTASNQRVGVAEISTVANTVPQAGSLSVSPSSGGITLQSTFTLTASGWSDSDTPLSYSFGYRSRETTVLLSQYSAASTLSTKNLPSGTYPVICFVRDSFGAVSSLESNVTVSDLSENEKVAVVNQAVNDILSQENIPVDQLGSSISSALDVINSASQASVQEKRDIREKLTTKLLSSVTSLLVVDEETFSQVGPALQSLTGNPSEGTTEDITRTVNVLNSLLTRSTTISSSSASILLSSLTNLLRIPVTQPSKRNEILSLQRSIENIASTSFSSILSTQNDILGKVANGMVNDQTPNVQTTTSFESVTARTAVASTSNYVISTTSTNPTQRVTLPSNLAASLSTFGPDIGVFLVSYTTTSNALSSANVTTNALNIFLKSYGTGSFITLTGTSSPMSVVAKGTFTNPSTIRLNNVTDLSATITTVTVVSLAQCATYNTATGNWISGNINGCMVESLTTNSAVLSISSNFDSSILYGVTVETRTLIPVPVPVPGNNDDNKRELNNNPTTLLFVILVTIIYIIGAFILSIVEIFTPVLVPTGKTQDDHEEDQSELIKKIVILLFEKHGFLSIILKPKQNSYYRPLRWTVFFIYIYAVMAIQSVFTFFNPKSFFYIHLLWANIIAYPLPFIFEALFRMTKSVSFENQFTPSNDKGVHVTKASDLDGVDEFQMDEYAGQDGEDAANVDYDMNAPPMMGNPAPVNKTENRKSLAVAVMQTMIRDEEISKKKVEADDEENGKDIKEIKPNDVLKSVQESVIPLGTTIAFIIFVLLYVSVFTLINIFESSFQAWLIVATYCGTIITIVTFLDVYYISSIINSSLKEMKTDIIAFSLLATANVLGVIITVVVGAILQFWSSFNGIAIVLSLCLLFTVLFAISIASLVVVIVKITALRNIKFEPNSVRFKIKFLPWFAMFVTIPLALFTMVVLAVFAIVFGWFLTWEEGYLWILYLFVNIIIDVLVVQLLLMGTKAFIMKMTAILVSKFVQWRSE